ncbi:MAG: integrase zinc binding domain-containing protein, partial [Halobacteriota archaeon]|nr:integrase zinc binding domain-containing protein [Halobacteriota archaeon]
KLVDDHFCPVIPDSSSSSVHVILSDLHNSALGGHLGFKKLLKAVSARFYWRGMSASVKSFVQ